MFPEAGILSKVIGLLAIVIAILLSYRLGFVKGKEAGKGEGFSEGKREGSKRGFLVGYDRGKRAHEGKDDEDEESPKSVGCAIIFLLVALLLASVAMLTRFST